MTTTLDTSCFLPVVRLPWISKTKRWFVDARLRQIRNVRSVGDYIDVSDVECALFTLSHRVPYWAHEKKGAAT